MEDEKSSLCAFEKTPRSAIYGGIYETIGKTPVVKLNHMIPPGETKDGVEVYAKLESENPGGSVKDRLAMGIIEWAEKHGELLPGQTGAWCCCVASCRVVSCRVVRHLVSLHAGLPSRWLVIRLFVDIALFYSFSCCSKNQTSISFTVVEASSGNTGIGLAMVWYVEMGIDAYVSHASLHAKRYSGKTTSSRWTAEDKGGTVLLALRFRR